MKRIFVDERTEHINGMVSFICLMLTHFALVGVMVYKRYFLRLPPGEYSEITWIACLSMAGYWTIRLYLSGILPVVSFKKLVAIYIVLVAAIFIPTFYIHGWPVAGRWYEVLYPFGGMAILMGFYSLVAYFGKRRLEKIIKQ